MRGGRKFSALSMCKVGGSKNWKFVESNFDLCGRNEISFRFVKSFYSLAVLCNNNIAEIVCAYIYFLVVQVARN